MIASRFKCPVITTTKDLARLGPFIKEMKREDAERFFALETEIEITKERKSGTKK